MPRIFAGNCTAALPVLIAVMVANAQSTSRWKEYFKQQQI
jgi:hypothetical protein